MLNRCEFIGNLGADPDIRTTQDGKRIANMRIACTEKWKSASGEDKERTEWVSLVVFSDGLSGIVERYLRKGSKIYVSGKLQTRKWQDQSGNDRYSTEVVLQGFDGKLLMLDTRGGGGAGLGGGQANEPNNSGGYGGGDMDDSIPFFREDR